MRRSGSEPPRTAKSRLRRAELLVAARTTFEHRGYFETRVADIVKQAEVSHGTFYTYFESKDDVLRSLVADVIDDLFDASTHPVARQPTPFLTLESSLRQFMHAYRDRAPMIRVVEQATSVSEEFLAVRLQIRARFAEAFARSIEAQQQRHPDRDGLDATVAAYALGGMAEDLARGRYLFGQHLDEDVAIATLAVIWARAIGLPVNRTGSAGVSAARTSRSAGR